MIDITAKPTRGGARKGAGPKPQFGEPMAVHAVRLDAATVETMRRLGGGELSAGIREAGRIMRERSATSASLHGL